MRGERLDEALVRLGLAPSRERARALILAGKVLIDASVADKPGTRVPVGASVELLVPDHPFVSRGGVKLEGALEAFGIDPQGAVCADIGASTGGFTHVLLKRGARRVFAVDVGYGQLADSLRRDPRVVPMERTNVRYLAPGAFDEPPSLVVIDVSFISVSKILPALVPLSAPGATFVVLVKPQFEVGREKVGKGGVVRDDALRMAAVDSVSAAARALGLVEVSRADSVLPGPKGNREVFLHLRRV
ncbi:MAG: TlyA family RNA methyltransferase [Deltaproteobacteria bacterium]|nr:TlyA family RNA methyltransferase [Deltaproteobacteria bacterium]